MEAKQWGVAVDVVEWLRHDYVPVYYRDQLNDTIAQSVCLTLTSVQIDVLRDYLSVPRRYRLRQNAFSHIDLSPGEEAV